MGIDWGKFFMDIGVATIIAAIGISLLADFKGWKDVQKKLGRKKTNSLEEQHESLEKTIGEKTNVIVEKTNNIERIQNNEFMRIFNKVDNIDKEIAADKNANKERIDSLSSSQINIRDNVNKLVYDWERTNLENKELKGRITELEKRNIELEIENKELITLLNKSRRRNKNMEL